jgi:sRNA-binding carbon storage regulator CsrA
MEGTIMLILTRRPGESIFIELSPEIDPDTPIGQLLDIPIEFRIIRSRGNQVSVGIEADTGLTIHRSQHSDAHDADDTLPQFGHITTVE